MDEVCARQQEEEKEREEVGPPYGPAREGAQVGEVGTSLE